MIKLAKGAREVLLAAGAEKVLQKMMIKCGGGRMAPDGYLWMEISSNSVVNSWGRCAMLKTFLC